MRLLPVSVTKSEPPESDERARAEEAPVGIAPLPEPLPVGPEAGDAVVPGVGDVDRSVRSDRDAARLVELAVAVAA